MKIKPILERIKDYLDNEESRATTSEQTLQTNIENVNTTLTNKINTDVANERQARIDADEALRQQVQEDIQPKLDALEDALDDEVLERQSEITRVEGLIDDEETRAKDAESTITSNLNQEILDRQNDVDAEQLRAEGAENTLNTRITNEVSTLNSTITSKEGEIKGLITQEVNRATTKENALEGALNEEISTRASDTTKEGNLLGFTKDPNTGEFSLTNNGYVKTTKDLADNNKARLDNLESEIGVSNTQTTINHDLTVEGDLVVKGTTTTTDQETIQSQATLIVTNSSNAPLVDLTGVVALKGTFQEYEVTASNYIKDAFYYKDNQNHYVLDDSATYTSGRQYYVSKAEAASVYDKVEDALLIGEGIYYGGTFVFDVNYLVITLTEHSYVPNKYYIKVNDNYVLATGDFDPNETYYAKVSQGQHLATRVDSAYLTDKHLIEWDGNSFILIDSGKSVADIENEILTKYNSLDTKISNEITNRQTAVSGVASDLSTHTSNTNNPHSVTKAQVGLGNVTNDAQVKGLASGSTEDHIIVFGSDGYTIKDSGKTLADTGKIDSISINGTPQPADANKNVDLPAYPTRTSLQINNVDNTSDLNKPISTATQSALDLKADKSTTYTKTEVDGLLGDKVDTSTYNTKVGELETAIGTKANASDVYTKTQTDTQIANAVNPRVNVLTLNSLSITKEQCTQLLQGVIGAIDYEGFLYYYSYSEQIMDSHLQPIKKVHHLINPSIEVMNSALYG